MKFRVATLLLSISATILVSCGDSGKPESPNAKKTDSTQLEYTVLSVLPHNPEAYTQGLVVHNGKILESTGQNGTSWIAEVNPGSGDHNKKVILDKQYFGEGITVLNNKIYQLTYTTKIGFVYDVGTYKKLKEFEFDPAIRQGWGITHDAKNLIVSDGTDKIHFLDTTTLKVIRSLPVRDGNQAVDNVNELEFIDGYIFANIYQTNRIIKIDPATGKVVGKMDLSAIGNEIRSMYPNADVLNGIAYDRNSKALLLTGKLWPKAYLIRIK
jgi:glutaminyl-peptide cyclotransferase